MRVRYPPGRTGRPWLAHRLEVARRGAEVLDHKRRALFRERQRLEPLVAETRSEWERTAAEARTWCERAAILGGQRQLELARTAVTDPAAIEIGLRRVLGTACPTEPRLAFPEAPMIAERGGSSALLCAVPAHRDAVEAAARFAAASAALERIERELRWTALRVNAIKHRWIPGHEAALAALDLALEELEREEAARVRWATRAGGGRSRLPSH